MFPEQAGLVVTVRELSRCRFKDCLRPNFFSRATHFGNLYTKRFGCLMAIHQFVQRVIAVPGAGEIDRSGSLVRESDGNFTDDTPAENGAVQRWGLRCREAVFVSRGCRVRRRRVQ